MADKKDPMVEYVVKEFERYESAVRDRFDAAEEIYDDWKLEPRQKKSAWQNDVCVPMIVEGEQTITPRLFTALFPTDAPIDVAAEGDAPVDQAVRIKGMIKHHFRVSDVQGEAWPALQQNTLFGTGYLEGGSWFVRRGWQIDKDTGTRYNTILENRPDCKHVNFFEMYPHPAKMRMDDGLPLIRRRYADAEFLKRLQDNPGFDTNSIKKALESKPILHGDEKRYNKLPRDEYEILEYWGPWDSSYEKDNKVVTQRAVPFWILVVNRTVNLRGIANPYDHQIPPYCKTILFPDPKPSWFGVGIGQIGKSSQDRVNKIVNQRLDNVDLVLNRERIYNANDPEVNEKKLAITEPGKIHGASSTDAIRWIDTPDVTRSAYQEEAVAKQDFREATGATAHLMPEAGSEHRTAMGIQMLQGAAGMRFRPVLRKMELDLIQALAQFYFSNLKQFMTADEWILITGKQGEVQPIKITPEQIQGQVQFIPTGVSEIMNKETQVAQLLRFKEVTMNDPTINRTEINKRIAELFGFKDIEKLTVQQQPTNMSAGVSADKQKLIQQRLAEGASPEQIKEELVGTTPGKGGQTAPQATGNQRQPPRTAPQLQLPGAR